jgi:hypothetical protein
MVFEIQKDALWKIQTVVVQVVPNLVFFPQHRFLICDKQIQPTPHPCKHKEAQALPTLYGFLRMENMCTKGGRSR